MFRIKIDTNKLEGKAYQEFIEFTKNQNYNIYYNNGILDTCIDSMEELNMYPNLKQFVIK
ncbi:hypothetical protein Biyabedamokiny2_00134 [Staphylococcus phage Biyabeda-mokiny_2]|nr:hypothetical protein Biyabedamokiny2_00134 [Staphylococcus phage Biyabeda-mokiny_2]